MLTKTPPPTELQIPATVTTLPISATCTISVLLNWYSLKVTDNSIEKYLEKRKWIIWGEIDEVALTVVVSSSGAPERLQLIPFSDHRVSFVAKYQRHRDGGAHVGSQGRGRVHLRLRCC